MIKLGKFVLVKTSSDEIILMNGKTLKSIHNFGKEIPLIFEISETMKKEIEKISSKKVVDFITQNHIFINNNLN